MADPLLLVFNELSSPYAMGDLAVGTQWLESLSDVLADPRCGSNRILVTPPSFLQFPIGGGYTVGRWLKASKNGDEPRWRRMHLLVDKRRDFANFRPPDLSR